MRKNLQMVPALLLLHAPVHVHAEEADPLAELASLGEAADDASRK